MDNTELYFRLNLHRFTTSEKVALLKLKGNETALGFFIDFKLERFAREDRLKDKQLLQQVQDQNEIHEAELYEAGLLSLYKKMK